MSNHLVKSNLFYQYKVLNGLCGKLKITQLITIFVNKCVET